MHPSCSLFTGLVVFHMHCMYGAVQIFSLDFLECLEHTLSYLIPRKAVLPIQMELNEQLCDTSESEEDDAKDVESYAKK